MTVSDQTDSSPKRAWWKFQKPRDASSEALPFMRKPTGLASPRPCRRDSAPILVQLHRIFCNKIVTTSLVVLAVIAAAVGVFMVPRTAISLEVCLGIGLLVLSTIFSIFGNTMMRMSHYRSQEIEHGLVEASSFSCVGQPRFVWWFGLTTFLIAQGFMPFALALAPLTVLAPLESWNLMINLVMAYLILAEEITRCDVLATIFSGCCGVGVMYFGPRETAMTALDATVIAMKMRWWDNVCMCTMLAISGWAFYIYIFRARLNWNKWKYFVIPWLHCSLTAFSFAVVKIFGSQFIHLREAMHVAEMLAYVRSIAVVLVLIGVCGPGSAYFKVRSTVEFDMRWFTPVKYALDVGLQLVMGAAVFHEWDGVDSGRLVCFMAFAFLCVISVLFIDPRDSLQEQFEARTKHGSDIKHGSESNDLRPLLPECRSPSVAPSIAASIAPSTARYTPSVAS